MQLDERKYIILQAIIRNYLETGEPVGSRTISKYTDLNLSSATIRNEMADLEELGYILQPHTSAGRIPSDQGYRLYVDKMMEEKEREVEEMKEILSKVREASFAVTEVKHGERSKKAPNPFTTSTLQQEASKVLNFSTTKTMRLAQQLYEGVDIKGHGTIGLITYLRTDSTRIAEEADGAARKYVEETYGEKYVLKSDYARKNGAKIQDAHEAIRPTDITLTPVLVKESLQRDLFRLYQLIWKRFTASRMQPAVYETTSVKIDAGEHRFTVAASKVKFDGFMSVYTQEDDK